MDNVKIAGELVKLAKSIMAGPSLYEMKSMQGGIDLIRVGLNKQTITVRPSLFSGGQEATWKKVLSDEVFQALDDVEEEAGMEDIRAEVKKLAKKFDEDIADVFGRKGFKR